MIVRRLALPASSFFLFGHRSTGRTTWLRSVLPDAEWFDLLDTGLSLELAKDPGSLFRRVAAFSAPRWVVIDEVQKVPALLSEVHRRMNDARCGHRFVLSGSSAHEIRREGANLLAGRAALQKNVVQRGYGVYLGDAPELDGNTLVLPLGEFCKRLAAGEPDPSAPVSDG